MSETKPEDVQNEEVTEEAEAELPNEEPKMSEAEALEFLGLTERPTTSELMNAVGDKFDMQNQEAFMKAFDARQILSPENKEFTQKPNEAASKIISESLSLFPIAEEKSVAVETELKNRFKVRDALEVFFDVRKVPGLKKKPSTSELIDWLKLLMADELSAKMLQEKDTSSALPPLYGALVKNEQDVHLLQKLAFMARRRS